MFFSMQILKSFIRVTFQAFFSLDENIVQGKKKKLLGADSATFTDIRAFSTSKQSEKLAKSNSSKLPVESSSAQFMTIKQNMKQIVRIIFKVCLWARS